ncbi:MAG: hypothetical protein NZO58_11120, partial [Gemmataceae bacterium]|nr:hypothetical protein [Gemmataceae bacterium]
MEQELTHKSEFLWRRLQETPPTWVVLLPVGFALVTVLLMWLFRRERGFKGIVAPLLVVGVVSTIYLILAPMLLPFAGWLVVLAPVLAVALLYVGLMYVHDARSIHPGWATFLGLLRCAVYAILATVFLLPGCQNYEQQKYHSKVVFFHDVSGSMFTVDDRPEIGQDPATLPTRQDKVLQFLTATLDRRRQPQEAFLKRVADKTPLTLYRFGSQLDEKFTLAIKQGEGDGKEELLRAWLRPDKSKIEVSDKLSEVEKQKERTRLEDLYDSLLNGTNLGGALLQGAKLESGNLIQAIIVVSDGQSNLGSDEAFREFHARVAGGRFKIPVITIGVGEYRQPASIRLEDMQAPEIARPDDKFPIRIPVIGVGLTDEEFTLTLEAQRIKDALGQPIADEKYVLPVRKGVFKGAGDFPQDVIEYEIDLQELRGIKEKDDTEGRFEGTWQFVAKVPRHPREAYAKAEHVSDPPTQVLVQKKKPRVLLFAGGPTHDYQFLRTLLHRESVENRLELSVLLQTGRQDHVEQDVEKDRLLLSFPDRLVADPGAKYMSLSEYDVIIAIDPDWRELEAAQVKLLRDWVDQHGGGVIFVAGPVHTFHVARPAGLDHLVELQKLFPVVLSDSRLPTLSLNHDPSRPYALNFTGSAAAFDFLKLDEEGEG